MHRGTNRLKLGQEEEEVNVHWTVPVVLPWCCPLLTLHQLHEDGHPGALLDGAVQGDHAGARHGRARRQLLGTEVFHLHLRKQGGTERFLGWSLMQLSLSGGCVTSRGTRMG